MDYLTIAILDALIIWLLVWERGRSSRVFVTLLIYVLATVLAFGSVWFTRLLPHALLVAFMVLVISIFVAVYERRILTKTLLFSLPLFAAVFLALAVSQLKPPTPGQVVIEDRSKRQPTPPPAELTISQQLATEWSANSVYADWPVARLMAKLCVIAYEAPVDARSELEKMGIQSETIGSGSMNGYVLSIDDSAIIILRGTEPGLFDILQDLYFPKVMTDHGGLHGGFYDGYISMHDQVQKLLKRYQPKRIWITGHSLGGALSVVCAYQLLEDNEYPIAGVMTFGQPMVVTSQMSQYLGPRLKDRYVHFVNNMDPVPDVVLPYVHFGHLVLYKNGKIGRSQRGVMMMGSSPNNTAVDNDVEDVPTLQSMTPEEFKKFLAEEKKASEQTKVDPNGRPIYQGSWRRTSDHHMDSYLQMVDVLLDPSGPLPQVFIKDK